MDDERLRRLLDGDIDAGQLASDGVLASIADRVYGIKVDPAVRPTKPRDGAAIGAVASSAPEPAADLLVEVIPGGAPAPLPAVPDLTVPPMPALSKEDVPSQSGGGSTLLLLGLLGALVLRREHGLRALLPFLPVVLGVFAVTTLYHPSSRYRLPMVIPLVWLGGIAVADLWRRREERQTRLTLALVLILALSTAFRGWTYEMANPARWELTLAESYRIQGDLDSSRRHMEEAVRIAPDDPIVRATLEYIEQLAPQ